MDGAIICRLQVCFKDFFCAVVSTEILIELVRVFFVQFLAGIFTLQHRIHDSHLGMFSTDFLSSLTSAYLRMHRLLRRKYQPASCSNEMDCHGPVLGTQVDPVVTTVMILIG